MEDDEMLKLEEKATGHLNASAAATTRGRSKEELHLFYETMREMCRLDRETRPEGK